MQFHEMTAAEADAAMHRYEGFLLALDAAAAGLGLEPTSEEYMRIWAVVQDVASGGRTLTPSPAEVNLAGGTRKLLDDNQCVLQARMRREREVAGAIVKAADGIVVRDAV